MPEVAAPAPGDDEPVSSPVPPIPVLKVDERRVPLRREEVPLPQGGDYTLDYLLDERKAKLLIDYQIRKRIIQEERVILYEKCVKDKEYRQLVYERCRRDARYFIDYFCWTYDDRLSVDEVFVLYGFQDEKIVQPYEAFCRTEAPNRVTLGYAKSRGIGFTWVVAGTRTRNFLFWDNWSILLGAENREDVDDGGQTATTNSLFGKVRYILNHLPKWMRDDLLGPLYLKEEFNKRWHLKNPKRPKTYMDGKQLGGMFGRQRRYSEAFADEAAHAEEMHDADTSIKQTTNRFCFGSTPKGMGNFFYQAMHGAIAAVVKFWMWWPEHPLLDIAWYNEQRNHMTDSDIAQELDISFTLSVGGRVLAEVNLGHFVHIPTESKNEFGYDEHLDLEVVIDPGFADALAIIWCQWDELNGKGRIIDFVQTERKAVDWVVPFITGKIPETTYRPPEKWKHEYNEIEKQIIARHAEWGPPKFVYGDAAGGAKQVNTGTSAWDELARYLIYVDEIKILDDEEALKMLELFMRHVHIAQHLRVQRNGPKMYTPTLLEVVTQWRYPERREGQVTAPSRKPVHDLYCHAGDTMKMWAQTHPLPDAAVQQTAASRILKKRGDDVVYDDGDSSPFRR